MGALRITFRAIAGLVLFAALWLLWPQELDSSTGGRGGGAASPDYTMTNAHYVSVKLGILEMESRAKDSVYNLAQRRMVSKTVVSEFYNALGQPTEVSSDLATFDQEHRLMHLAGHVRSESPDGFVLTGPEADYDLNKKYISAAKPVEAVNDDATMRAWGNRAEGSMNDRKLYLYGDARGQFNDPKHGLTNIRGDRALIDRDEASILFNDNVRMTQEKMAGTSRTAQMFYAGDEKTLRYMSLLEDVKLDRGDGSYTRSQVAEFFAPTDTIVLSGFPSVYRGEDAVTGDRITLYRATGVVEVTQTNAAASKNSVRGKGQLPLVPLPKPAPLTKEDDELIP